MLVDVVFWDDTDPIMLVESDKDWDDIIFCDSADVIFCEETDPIMLDSDKEGGALWDDMIFCDSTDEDVIFCDETALEDIFCWKTSLEVSNVCELMAVLSLPIWENVVLLPRCC